MKLLSGGHQQIARGYGEAPVQAYLQAIPDRKREVPVRSDALITRALPKVEKAVKGITPMYGTDGKIYFMGFHMVTKYVKVAIFQGALLKPMPPDASTQKKVRYLHTKSALRSMRSNSSLGWNRRRSWRGRRCDRDLFEAASNTFRFHNS